MLPEGNLFHIDFGFIFGRDPKPLPPPFRFTRHMAEAMGGEDSEYYQRFKAYCCQVSLLVCTHHRPGSFADMLVSRFFYLICLLGLQLAAEVCEPDFELAQPDGRRWNRGAQHGSSGNTGEG